ncbi:hypothetical protein LTR10_000148 [Elasticomyces elasticus]|nr:hypothetical protein LTR10_000148 [Elasticomyces elasticus]KAK4980594.1 hypothetical protein LTR42_000902 [Elasticomyces elasticus]
MYQVNAFGRIAILVHKFAAADNAFGPTELWNDVFAVAAANSSLESGIMWPGNTSSDPTQAIGELVTSISTFPDIGWPTGMYDSAATPGLVLLADSYKAVIWRIDTVTGGHTQFLEDPAPGIPANATSDLGINGIKVSSTSD